MTWNCLTSAGSRKRVLSDSDKYEEIFDEEIEDAYDEELTNPIKHYIKEMGGVGLSRGKEKNRSPCASKRPKRRSSISSSPFR